MELTCPRCLWSFYPHKDLSEDRERVKKETGKDPQDLVYVHECQSGYLRPYPQFMCTSCGPLNDDTELKTLTEISDINHQRKLLRYREKSEDQIIEAGLGAFA